MEFEAILKKVGHFGRYQHLILVLIGLLILINTTHLYIQVFTAGKSDHWCKSWTNDGCPIDSGRYEINCEQLKKILSVPKGEDNSTYEQCWKYNVSGIDVQTAIELGDDVKELEVISCDQGWEYDRSSFPSTIIQDFELVCGKSYLPNVAQSAYFVGYLVGSALGGLLADAVGRRIDLLLCIVGAIVIGLLTTASPNMLIFIALRFFMATFLKGIGVVGFVTITEIVSPTKRILVGNVIWLYFAVGYFVLAGSAKVIGNWRFLTLLLTLSYVPVVVLIFFFLQESPVWLLARHDNERATKVLTKIASVNKREASNEELQNCSTGKDEGSDTNVVFENLGELVRSPTIILLAVNMSFNWIVQNLVYYGLSLSTSSLGFDPYWSFVFSGVVEIPAYFCCIVLAEWLGRKPVTFSTMLLGGICCCVTPFVPLGITRLIVALGGKFFITMSYSIVYTWAAEFTPTPLRSSGVGLFSLTSRIGSIVAPFILLLDEVWDDLPVIVFGSFAIGAGLLCLLMPETKGKPLPASIEDTKALYRNANDVQCRDEQDTSFMSGDGPTKPTSA